MSERPIRGAEAVDLPPGFSLRSMADDDDVEARRTVLGLAFGHADPAEWVTPETYRELQRAPDYRKDLDLYVVAPDGAFAACCIAWHDPVNRVGTFEPVGTHPAFRRMGLGRAVIMEGINRLAAPRRDEGVGRFGPGLLRGDRVHEEIQGNNLDKAALKCEVEAAFVTRGNN